MTSWHDIEICPKCDGDLRTHGERFNLSGECLECGYYFVTIEKTSTLEDLNDARDLYDLPPLEKLKDQIY